MIVLDPNSPYNASTDKINTGSRTGSAAGDMIADQSDFAEDTLGEMGERGEQYKQQVRRQRLVAQRIRQLDEKDASGSQIRGPRNAKFQKSNNEGKQILSYTDIATMSGIALIFDVFDGLLSLIPVVGNVIVGVTVFPAATLYLFLAYRKRGIKMQSTKTLVKFWGTLLVSFIPIVSILPQYVLNVVLISLEKKAEEKLNIK